MYLILKGLGCLAIALDIRRLTPLIVSDNGMCPDKILGVIEDPKARGPVVVLLALHYISPRTVNVVLNPNDYRGRQDTLLCRRGPA